MKNFGLLYSDIKDIKLAPAYDVVSTTVYIKKDIPALFLLGSKKWWSEKFLLRFATQTCDLSMSEANALYEECEKAFKKVLAEIENRLLFEEDEDKLVLLKHLASLLSKSNIL